jgi:hypothetical protein
VKKLLRLLVPLLVLAALIIPAIPASAATYDTITVTATPAFMSISLENLGTGADDAWLVNGFASSPGDGYVDTSTTYFANPLGDKKSPADETASEGADKVANGECGFGVTDTSTVVIQLKAKMSDFSDGDAMTNGAGTPGENAYAAWVWKSGDTYSTGKKIIPTTDSDAFFTGTIAGDGDILIGFTLSTKTDEDGWTSGTTETATLTITASRKP